MKMKKLLKLIEQDFMEDLEKLTDDLIDELHRKGWDLDQLKTMQSMGLFYCRESNSFFSSMHYCS